MANRWRKASPFAASTSATASKLYRLQNSRGVPYPFTLPAQFVNYIADGKPVATGEPVRGQYVRNSTESAPTTAEKK